MYEDEQEEKAEKPAPRRMGARKDEGEMEQEELQSFVTSVADSCQKYVDEKLTPDRAEATEYYLGEPFGNEKEGRSQVVMTEVRDQIDGPMPSFLRSFFGPEQVLEFEPTMPGKEQAAEEATRSVRYVFEQDNNGFMLTRSVYLDAMVRKLGIFKWGYERSERVADSVSGVTRAALESLAADESVELTKVEPREIVKTVGEEELTVTVYDVNFTKEKPGRVCVFAVPPEEIIYNDGARSPDDAICFGHITDLPAGDLIAMGLSQDDLEAHGGSDEQLSDSELESTRRLAEADGAGEEGEPDAGEANDLHRYGELYMRLDVDGDGIAELRLFKTIGPHFHVFNGEGKGEVIDEIPFAIFCPFPEPHTMTGQSQADRTMDLQYVKSGIVRATLDSLALSIFPRTWYVETQTNAEDILNTEIGAPIRTRGPNMVGEFSHTFVGREAMPLLSYFDDVAERRTGRNKGAMGMDADALQSTTKQGVDSAVTSAQEHTELLARVFAEQALKPLFRGILRCLVKNQKVPRQVRMEGQWATIDPTQWDPNMGLRVRVALGSMLIERKLQVLGEIATKQELALQALGPDNPLVTLGQYANTLRRAVVLSGHPNPNEFFNAVPLDWKPEPQPPQPTPEQVLAEAQLKQEEMKTQRELLIKQHELELKREEMTLEHQRKMEEMAMEAELKRLELEMKYNADIQSAELAAATKERSTMISAEIQERAGEHQRAIAEHSASLKEMEQRHKQEIRELELAHNQALAEAELRVKAEAARRKEPKKD